MATNEKLIVVKSTKDDNTLVDVHVNNPLKKVLTLLEELKKQKAFTFDIKGSLGIAGILLVVSTFGLFGGDKLLCDRGTATQVGLVRILQITEDTDSLNLSWYDNMLVQYFGYKPNVTKNRVVLLLSNGSPLHIVTDFTDKLAGLNGRSAFITGSYNSCSQTMTVTDEKGLEAQ